MDRVAVGVYRSAANDAIFVLYVMRFLRRQRSPVHGFFKGLISVVYFERDIAHAIAVFSDMLGRRVVRPHRRGENKVGLALTHRVRSASTLPCFQSAVSDLRKTKALAVKERRLAGIADPEFDVVNALKLEWVLHPLAP